jgi:hypothetical protein
MICATLQGIAVGSSVLPLLLLTSDYTEVCLGLKRIEHLYDVLMPQLPQDFNLLPQVPYVLF